jgi:uncharacterized membrane protein YphA (DoxX/SURF4 family)
MSLVNIPAWIAQVRAAVAWILPWLTPLAATGLAALMLVAAFSTSPVASCWASCST